MIEKLDQIVNALRDYFPVNSLQAGTDTYRALERGLDALSAGSLSWAQLNQIMHLCSEAAMSEGFFRYYFLEAARNHPYPVEETIPGYKLPEGVSEIQSLEQFEWGLRRFINDGMLYWGNIRQAYRDLRRLELKQIEERFARERVDTRRIQTRGKITPPSPIEHEHRYLISETACKMYGPSESPEEAEHVRPVVEAFIIIRFNLAVFLQHPTGSAARRID